MIVGDLCGLLVLVVVFGAVAFVKDVRATLQPGCDKCLGYGKCDHCGRGHKRHHFADLEGRYGWDEDGPLKGPTNLDTLVEKYMAADPADMTATIDFLVAAEGLKPEDCFKEASVVMKAMPIGRVAEHTKPGLGKQTDAEVKAGQMYDVMDDLARAYTMTYGVPTHSLQCELCGQIGSFSNGACHACGGRAAHHPSWAIWFDGRAVDYLDKRRMEEDAYQLQKDGKKITIFDSNGKQIFVAPAPKMLKSECKQCRDAKGRFTKKREVLSIHPMDEPYPIERITPWPGKTIRD